MKIKKKRFISAILFLLVGFILGQLSNSPTPISIKPTSSPNPETFKVLRVVDGDTIELEPSTSSGQEPSTSSGQEPSTSSGQGGQIVRYIGINAPETVDPRRPVQCFGVEASKKNKELVEGKIVRLEKDVSDKDKYGRLLRYVYVAPSPPTGGSGQAIFVNLELVKQGFAHSYTYPPDVKHQEEFLTAEREAREANRGLWRICPI